MLLRLSLLLSVFDDSSKSSNVSKSEICYSSSFKSCAYLIHLSAAFILNGCSINQQPKYLGTLKHEGLKELFVKFQ